MRNRKSVIAPILFLIGITPSLAADRVPVEGIWRLEGRKPPTTDQDRVELFNSLVSYTGKYRVDGDKWVTMVDVSANPAWVGTEQTRTFRVTEDQLQEMTDWFARPDNRMARAVITYERVK